MTLLVDRDSPRWPQCLEDLEDPPRRLWVRGTLPPSDTVAVVGTRRPSPAGRAAAIAVTTELVHAGMALVTGLAPGVDREVHEAAMASGVPTWAVVGGAVDRLGPSAEAVALRLVDGGGGVLSEHPPGTPASYKRRVTRNRIQAALARVVVVIETGRPDGTMETVDAAVALGRSVQILDPNRWELGEACGNRALLGEANPSPEVPDDPAVSRVWRLSG